MTKTESPACLSAHNFGTIAPNMMYFVAFAVDYYQDKVRKNTSTKKEKWDCENFIEHIQCLDWNI